RFPSGACDFFSVSSVNRVLNRRFGLFEGAERFAVSFRSIIVKWKAETRIAPKPAAHLASVSPNTGGCGSCRVVGAGGRGPAGVWASFSPLARSLPRAVVL